MWFGCHKLCCDDKAHSHLRRVRVLALVLLYQLLDGLGLVRHRAPIRESAKMASAGGDLNVSVWLIHLMKRRMRTRSLSRVAEATHPPERSIDRR